MPLTRDTSTTSDSHMTEMGKSKEVEDETSSSTEDPQNTVTKSQTRAKSKRPLSGTPLASTAKRPTKATASSSQQPSYLAYTSLPPDWLTNLSSPSPGPSSPTVKTLQLTYHTGDIFASAPPTTLLIHACNTRGHWGAGIARAFKDLYPSAYTLHHDFCTKSPHSKTNSVPTGTAQLIPPTDPQGHWIGCLFTSAGYGRKKDGEESILRNTGLAMEMLLELVRRAEEGGMRIGEVRMCRINSGKFGVEWERSEAVLKGVVVREGWRGEVGVWGVE
jgi:ADP-ribose 1''-phosphate phosphatase